MENYYVYHLINPLTNLVFYVGKGCRYRCYQHLNDTLERAHNKRLWGYINNLRKKGVEPLVIKVQGNLTEQYAYDLEELEIKKYGRKGIDDGGILMNLTNGGEGVSGWVPPDEWRKNKSDSMKGEKNPFYGKTHTEETKKLIGDKNRGKPKPKTEEYKENSKKAALEYWSNESEQTKQRKEKLKEEGRKYWEGTEEEIEAKKDKLRKLYEKKYLIVWPDGTEEVIVNLKQTCIEKGFNHSLVYQVMAGKRPHHRGCKFYKLE